MVTQLPPAYNEICKYLKYRFLVTANENNGGGNKDTYFVIFKMSRFSKILSIEKVMWFQKIYNKQKQKEILFTKIIFILSSFILLNMLFHNA